MLHERKSFQALSSGRCFISASADQAKSKASTFVMTLVAERVRQTFSDEALEKLDLKLAEKSRTRWLKSIFRKHRKAF